MAIGCWFCKCNRKRADYSSLPDDITEQILLKLPCIKSIVTCTSVCKSWYALIKSPRFVNLQLSSSYNSKKFFACFYSIDYCDSKILHEYYYDLKFPHEGTIKIFGSCNGLICYGKCGDDDAACRNIYMWNPAIRRLRIIPQLVLYPWPSAYGFWFDTDADDYKVARVSYTEVEVYSLSTNTWDTIFRSGRSGQYPRNIGSDVVHLNGSLHWLLLRENGWNIMCLNIKIRKLREPLILPVGDGRYCPILLKSGTSSRSLIVLKYKLFTWNLRGVLAYDESLSKLYRIEFAETGIEARPVGVRNNGKEFLFQKVGNITDGGMLLVCDVEDFKFKDFSPSTCSIFELRPFAETLDLLNDKDSSSTANSSMSMVCKARFTICLYLGFFILWSKL